MSEYAEHLKQLVREIHGSHHIGDAQGTKLHEIERMIDAHKAQLDVAMSGYKQAVRTAQWQAVSNSELNASMNVRVQRDELLDAAKLLIEQYESSGDFVMGGNLTNKPFLMLKAAIAKATA